MMTMEEWLAEDFGCNPEDIDLTDMYEADPDMYNELEIQWNEAMRKEQENK